MGRDNGIGRHYSLKTRLYAVLAFLALLPLCGVLFTLISQQQIKNDDLALQRAAAGTIHLERINGLVYAATMESRGIYMSPNWDAAKRFADNLTNDLTELQQLLPVWQQDAANLREQNVKEVSQRVEDFIRFRTELVRLAKEQGPAAARALGDNETNRAVRTSLNQSLISLSRAYEQGLLRNQQEVEEGDREFVSGLAALAAVAGIALCGGFVLVRNSLMRPLFDLKDRMRQLAAGDLDAPFGGAQAAAEVAEMGEAVEQFRQGLLDRQRLSRETALLSSFNEWLQSCNSLGELNDMVGLFLGRLLPGSAGTLFIYAHSRDMLECASVWNGGKTIETMHPEDCWGLRRGRTYTFGESPLDFPCVHVGEAASEPYCCIPIIAHGDAIGLLHLKFSPADVASPAAGLAERRRLGMACAEQISLAVANVRLRDQLRDQSIRDPLTGLFNRRYLLETCRREFARAAREGLPVGALSIDVDHFKRYNDEHGHDAGDTVLRAVGSTLEALFRAEDVPCRFGGEEFVVILPGADIAATGRRAEQLRSRIEAMVVRYLERDLPHITVSIGTAAFPEAGGNPETVLRAADEALYRAKANGRNRVEAAMVRAAGDLPAIVPESGPQPTRMPLDEAADG